jgi:protein-L-isoaspartate(D-aspartate) O-methyltransferase
VLTRSLPIEVVRRCYAEEVRFSASLRSGALAEAFAAVPRENYAGPGPWQIQKSGGGYVSTETADPRELYHDALVAIDPERQLNNGHPSSLAGWIDMLELRPGSRVFHVGCGTGYYTAIMAEVVTPAGRVVAVEIDAGLASRAAANLAHLKHVVVACADGIAWDPGVVDAIFINAGVTHPQSSWLERLSEGGLLLVPITVVRPDLSATSASGKMLLVHRLGSKYQASFVTPVAIYSSPSGRDPDRNRVLARRFSETLTGKRPEVQSVRVDPHAVDENCWLHIDGACLSTLP